MNDRRRLVSVVVPVYDSPSLAALVAGIEAVFQAAPDDYEIVFVDDGSPDRRIWPQLAQLAREHGNVRAVQLTRNFGQQPATLCGLREARGDVVITMDDDLQHDPADIPLLLSRSDHDIVIAQFERKAHGVLRRLASRAKGRFDEIIIGKPKHLQLTSFRLLSRTTVDGVLSMRTPDPFLPALMFHVTGDVVGVAVNHQPRVRGQSGYTLRRLVRLFSNLIISNSAILLRLVAVAGLLFAFLSFSLSGVVIYRKLVHKVAVQGWTSIFVATLLTAGMLLVSFGIVGEYLIRIIHTSESRPTHFVRRRTE